MRKKSFFLALAITLFFSTQEAKLDKLLHLGKLTIRYNQIYNPPDEPGVTKYMLAGKIVLVSEDSDKNGRNDTWFRYNSNEIVDLMINDTDGDGIPDEYETIDDDANLENATNTFTEKKIIYFGAAFARYQGEGIKILGVIDDTPAQQAGLKKDDIIMEVNNISFRAKGTKLELFSGMAQDLPEGSPARFHIKRAGKKFDIWIKPLRLNKEQNAAFVRKVQKKFAGYYSRGKRAMAQENYAGAIEYFKKSVKTHPLKSYRYIGVCYLHQKQFKEALKYIVKAFKMDKKSPVSTFYLANCCDNMGKIIDAKYYYKKYLKMKYSNPKLNSYANRRLKELKKKKRKKNWSGELLRVMDAILKEIK